jgi:hypothetical protein
MIVLCWTKAATNDLRDKIAKGEINPNIQTAAYLGNVVSGEIYPEYEAPPPNGHATDVTRFRRLFRRIQLERELNGRQLAGRRVEEGKKRSYWLLLYYCACVYLHIELPSCRRGH